MKQLTTIACLLLLLINVKAQDIEHIASAKPFVMTGFVNAGVSYLDDNRETSFTSPLGYFATVGLNLNIYGALQIPLSFTYSDQQTSFQRPSFRTFGISPSYKWVTLHAGYRSFNISPLLMSGSQVKGLGIELTPGPFQLLVFKGDLTHRYNFGYNTEVIAASEIEVYKRNATGARLGLGSGQNYVRFSILKITDDELSGSQIALDTLSILPQENLGLAFSGGMQLFSRLTFETNVAGSALNSNTRSPLVDTDGTFSKLSDAFMEINESTRYAFTYDAGVTLRIANWRVGAKFQHVDPGYETLGYVYLQQDINNYTGFISGALFRSRLIVNANVGFQYNNTKEQFAQKDRRAIYNGSVNWSIQPRLQWSASYNNFNSDGNLSVTEVVDSLQFTTDNVGYSSNVNYSFGPRKSQHSINLNVSKNSFQIVRGEEELSTNTSSNYSLSYSKKIENHGLKVGGSLRLSDFNDSEENTVTRKGISLSVQKSLSKSISLKLRPSYDINGTNGSTDGSVINLRLRASYKVSTRTTIASSVNYRNRKTEILNPFSQIRMSFSFNSRF